MATVMIACKLPAGLTLEVDGVKKKINGYNSPDGFIMVDRDEKIGLTTDVDKSFWDKWRETYKDHPLVAGKKPYNQPYIFETKSESSAKAQAKELKGVKSGLDQKNTQELDKATGAKKDSDEV